MRRVTRQNTDHVLRPQAWKSVGSDALWRACHRRLPPVDLSWPLTSDERAQIRIRWPKRYGWEHEARMVRPLLRGLQAIVNVEPADVPQPHGNIVVFEFVIDDVVLRVAVDHEDRTDLHETVDDFPVFFKLQHQREGYGRSHVRPGGYITNRFELYQLYPRFREMRRTLPPRYDVYGRFSLKFAADTRRRVIGILQEQTAFGFEGGLSVVTWNEYMREVCRARMVLHLPGRGPFTYRLVENLAVGACMLGPEPDAILHVPLVSGEHTAYTRRDLDELVAVGARYLADEDARDHMARRGAEFFDRYLRPEQLAAYYLHECVRAAQGA